MNKSSAYRVLQNLSPFWTHFLGCFPDCYYPTLKVFGNLFNSDATFLLTSNYWTSKLKHEGWIDLQRYHFLGKRSQHLTSVWIIRIWHLQGELFGAVVGKTTEIALVSLFCLSVFLELWLIRCLSGRSPAVATQYPINKFRLLPDKDNFSMQML